MRFYLDLFRKGKLARLVFVDNSRSDLGVLEAEAKEAGLADRCEFISFAGLDYPPEYGYGFGEFKLVDHAMSHSRFTTEFPDAIVVKVTGRYVVRNLEALLGGLPGRFDVACDVRNWWQPWADMRVMAWTPAGYERVLRGVYTRLRRDLTRLPPEMEMSKHLLERSRDFGIVRRLAREPFVHGIRGLDGKNWTEGPFLAKHYLRAVLRRLFFWYPI